MVCQEGERHWAPYLDGPCGPGAAALARGSPAKPQSRGSSARPAAGGVSAVIPRSGWAEPSPPGLSSHQQKAYFLFSS